ncbi:MAG: hypothetical protein J3K34DRAFT_154459 [Monoraphidium minutum]|nr:MAG: hypothetical protein J3K34DRAFT_154459 [Monoraphidium minutum]
MKAALLLLALVAGVPAPATARVDPNVLLQAKADFVKAKVDFIKGIFHPKPPTPPPSPSPSPPPGPTCPPPGFDSAAGFDLAAYVSAPWYPLQQMPIIYQPANQLYCVRAVYTPKDPANLAAGIKVLNTANEGSVTGPPISSDSNPAASLQAVPAGGAGPTAASKLLVGPAFLPASLYGPYWVVAFAPDYSWAIVSGGAPTQTLPGGCATLANSVNNSGFWLFSRKPEDAAALAEMRSVAAGLGYDLSVLQDVAHAGCTYPPAPAAKTAGH